MEGGGCWLLPHERIKSAKPARRKGWRRRMEARADQSSGSEQQHLSSSGAAVVLP